MSCENFKTFFYSKTGFCWPENTWHYEEHIKKNNSLEENSRILYVDKLGDWAFRKWVFENTCLEKSKASIYFSGLIKDFGKKYGVTLTLANFMATRQSELYLIAFHCLEEDEIKKRLTKLQGKLK